MSDLLTSHFFQTRAEANAAIASLNGHKMEAHIGKQSLNVKFADTDKDKLLKAQFNPQVHILCYSWRHQLRRCVPLCAPGSSLRTDAATIDEVCADGAIHAKICTCAARIHLCGFDVLRRLRSGHTSGLKHR